MAGEHQGERIEAAERRAQVVEMRRDRMSYTAIGKRLGVSRQRAHQIYMAALAAIVAPAVEALRAEHLQELAEARELVMTVMRADHVIVQQGHVVSEITGQDDEGKPIFGDALRDHGPVLDAARTLAAIQARESKLVGGDAPTKVEAEVTNRVDPETIELRSMLLDQQARNDAERERLAEGS